MPRTNSYTGVSEGSPHTRGGRINTTALPFVLLGALSLLFPTVSCSSDSSTASGTGGSKGSGGSSGSGGSTSTGGSSGTGGATGSGGSSGIGGVSGTGGSSASGGMSGAAGGSGTAGAANGGAGGVAPTGGSGGGAGSSGVGGFGGGGGALTGGASGGGASGAAGGGGTGSFSLSSPVLAPGATFPAEITCAGANRSPELNWTAGPAAAASYALVLTDKTNGYLHWVIWDIPVATRSLPAMLGTTATLTAPAGARQVALSGNGYTGPCPSGSLHMYQFDLHAIDVAMLPGLSASPTTAQANTALLAHSLSKASLAGQSSASRP